MEDQDEKVRYLGLGLEAKIQEHGYTFIGVFDPDGKNPTFAYSLGLSRRGWPEVLLIGNIHPRVIEAILTDLIKSWEANGSPIIGDNADAIKFADGSSHPLRVVPVDATHAVEHYARQAPTYADEHHVEVVQVCWPDQNGVYPQDEGYNTAMTQPLLPTLYEPGENHG